MSKDNIPSDEDDDLFGFDDNLKPLVTSATSGAKPATSGANKAPAAALPATAPPKPATVRVEPQQVLPAASPTPTQIGPLKRVAPIGIEASDPSIVGILPAPAAGRPRTGSLTIAALLVAAVLNVALIGVVWRSMSGVGDALREVGDHVAHANDLAGAQAPGSSGVWQALTIQAPAPDEGGLTLNMASEEIQRGEFEQARARLYSLLCVIDRFDAKSRSNLASRAQVLVADSYREQADAVEREAAAPGYLDAAQEKRP